MLLGDALTIMNQISRNYMCICVCFAAPIFLVHSLSHSCICLLPPEELSWNGAWGCSCTFLRFSFRFGRRLSHPKAHGPTLLQAVNGSDERDQSVVGPALKKPWSGGLPACNTPGRFAWWWCPWRLSLASLEVDAIQIQTCTLCTGFWVCSC